MKNNKGVTLVALAVIIIIMVFILYLTIDSSLDLMKKSKITDYIGYMRLIKSRANAYYEDYFFEKTNSEILAGMYPITETNYSNHTEYVKYYIGCENANIFNEKKEKINEILGKVAVYVTPKANFNLLFPYWETHGDQYYLYDKVFEGQKVYFYWGQDELAKQGIDKSILGKNHFFLITFNVSTRTVNDVIYSEGLKFDNITNKIILKNGDKYVSSNSLVFNISNDGKLYNLEYMESKFE